MKKIFNLSHEIKPDDVSSGALKVAAEVRNVYGTQFFPQFNVHNEDVSIVIAEENGRYVATFAIADAFVFHADLLDYEGERDAKDAIQSACYTIHSRTRTMIRNGRVYGDATNVLQLIPDMAQEGSSYFDPFDGTLVTTVEGRPFIWDDYFVRDVRDSLAQTLQNKGVALQWKVKKYGEYCKFFEVTAADIGISGKTSKHTTLALPQGVLRNTPLRALIDYVPSGFEGLPRVGWVPQRQTVDEINALTPKKIKKEYSGTFDGGLRELGNAWIAANQPLQHNYFYNAPANQAVYDGNRHNYNAYVPIRRPEPVVRTFNYTDLREV